ncbi:hypothetical protein BDV11DRAFT_167871 [Aspergillus similis]
MAVCWSVCLPTTKEGTTCWFQDSQIHELRSIVCDALGKLYSIYVAKKLSIFFLIKFMAAVALCGCAPNMLTEIASRTWASDGGNGMYYGLLNLASSSTLEKERPAYLGLV